MRLAEVHDVGVGNFIVLPADVQPVNERDPYAGEQDWHLVVDETVHASGVVFLVQYYDGSRAWTKHLARADQVWVAREGDDDALDANAIRAWKHPDG